MSFKMHRLRAENRLLLWTYEKLRHVVLTGQQRYDDVIERDAML